MGFICFKIALQNLTHSFPRKNKSDQSLYSFGLSIQRKKKKRPISSIKSGSKKQRSCKSPFGEFSEVFRVILRETPFGWCLRPDRTAWSQRANRPLTGPQKNWDDERISWEWEFKEGEAKVGMENYVCIYYIYIYYVYIYMYIIMYTGSCLNIGVTADSEG